MFASEADSFAVRGPAGEQASNSRNPGTRSSSCSDLAAGAPVITTALSAFVLIFLLAGVVGVLDNLRAPDWRQVAVERRRRWETRRRLRPAGR
jgi:hypothetical protein